MPQFMAKYSRIRFGVQLNGCVCVCNMDQRGGDEWYIASDMSI